MRKIPERAVAWIKEYLRYTDYLSVAQLYLRENFFLEKPLEALHIKPRVLGHFGTVPGLNLIYAGLNYVISQHKCEMLLVTGPGHGAPAVLANLFAEGSLREFYREYPVNGKGAGQLIRDFSWPYSNFPSHVTPSVPGSILEGGELGYSLATAFGAAFDNPNLVVAAIVGDGEAETGAIAAAWHSNKFLNPRTSGAVLPIVHINSYKISNPTVLGRMSDAELRALFIGYGYEPIIVKGPGLEEKMLAGFEEAYLKIRAVQKEARRKGALPLKPKWPVVLLQSPKGWKGIREFDGDLIEGTFHSHGVPVEHLQQNPSALEAVARWLESYKVHELVDTKGRPKPEVCAFVPKGKLRMGMSPHANGGQLLKKLSLPRLSPYSLPVRTQDRGALRVGNMETGAKMIRDLIAKNPRNFLIMCPDELESNKLGAIFEKTTRAFMWPLMRTDEDLSPDGRAMEILSEQTLQGWLQGYLLTGRHGLMVSYEAFMPIISSMLDQYAKFLKQSFRVKWRKPIGAAVYLLSSVGWRQDHNGYSHQNPSFVSSVLMKHGEFSQIYYPADAHSLMVAFEETFMRRDSICVIVAEKRPLPQWLTLSEARRQAKTGIGIWEWVTGRDAAKNPDVVLASAGDYITQEAMVAVQLCKELVPELKIRFVNVSELTSMCLGDTGCGTRSCTTQAGVDAYFTKDKPVVFSYHGYVNDIEQILWPHANSQRFSLHGYREEGSTTTPFDMAIRNGVSCYHLAMDLIERGAKVNKTVARRKRKAIALLEKKIRDHQRYICEHGDDPPEVKTMRWTHKK